MSEPSPTLHTDVAVLGAGPGGYAAAFHAADKGMKVALIDARSKPGGVCLHVGCIPSKALLHIAALIDEAGRAEPRGVKFGKPVIDLDVLRDFKRGVVEKMVGGLAQLCKARGVQYVQGTGVFMDSERLRIEDSPTEMICFKHAVLATGSSPVVPLGIDASSPRVMNSTGALALPETPSRLLVVGGGYIGLELATVYAALGSRVTIVEFLDGLLANMDRDLVRPVAQRLKKIAEAIHLKTKVTSIAEEGDELRVAMEGEAAPAEQIFDRVLLAVGRRPNSQGIGLENTNVQIDERGFVQVDAQRRTSDDRIYAIGDVAGEPMLAHKATAEGKIAAEAIAGESAAFEPRAIPAVVFTDPEIATCGLSETEAKERGIEVDVRRFPWGASGRAATLGRADGITKIICERDGGRVLGMGITGPGAGELIAEGTLAIEMGAVAEDLAHTIHPHPTLSETIMESAELIFGSTTHLYRPPAKKK